MNEPLVSIIVTSYCPESKPYLDLCMHSILNLNYKNVETIIVGRPDYTPWYVGAMTVSPPEPSFWNGRGINYGVEHSSGEYLFIVNDDCMLTPDCIHALLYWASGNFNVMPMGNDQQGRYISPDYFEAFEKLKSRPDELMKINPVHGMCGILADTLCLYAHMVSRKLWDKVGPMDDNSGLIDIDWSLRVRQAGAANLIALNSLVWHFGGSSVLHTLDDTKRAKQREQFKAKWGFVP